MSLTDLKSLQSAGLQEGHQVCKLFHFLMLMVHLPITFKSLGNLPVPAIEQLPKS